MIFIRFLQIPLFMMTLCAPALAQDVARPQPEVSTGYADIAADEGQDFMAVTANPYATQAAYDILANGGSAADAAIAAQLVLGLVEPQSSGLGGGAFILHYDAKSKALKTYDGRETAPSLAGPFLFQDQGKPMAFFDAVVGGRAVGVPGMPALLKEFHQLHGSLTWMELFDEPVKLAEEGFEVSPRLAKMIDQSKERLSKFPQTAAYFLPGDKPLQAGQILKNPDYAETLKEYRFYGPARFYQGTIVADIVRTVQAIEENPGLLSAHDFADYEIKSREPVCGPYRGYIICSMGEPSSGGLTLLQILGMLEPYELTNDAKGWNLIAQASALAFADRNLYMADPDFVDTPGIALIDPQYLKTRSVLIDREKPLAQIKAGEPQSWKGPEYEASANIDKPGTTHISVIDKQGNVVSMTSSIEGAFGSHVMTHGFLLNNQLTDFAFTPVMEDQKLVANMAEGGKRPRSSMSPTIVFDKAGAPVLVVGSAGGSRIIGYVLQRIISILDWGMSVEEAMASPHILARSATIEMEDQRLQADLNNIGHQTEIKNLTSGLTAIHIQDDALIGVADPRREGTAKGE